MSVDTTNAIHLSRFSSSEGTKLGRDDFDLLHV